LARCVGLPASVNRRSTLASFSLRLKDLLGPVTSVKRRLPRHTATPEPYDQLSVGEREFFIDNLLVRIHFIIEMIWWTGLAPWELSVTLSVGAPLSPYGIVFVY